MLIVVLHWLYVKYHELVVGRVLFVQQILLHDHPWFRHGEIIAMYMQRETLHQLRLMAGTPNTPEKDDGQ